MRVRMLAARFLQDAGVERPLSTGEVYELPLLVARRLVDAGDAVAEPDYETVAVAVRETKPRGRRR